MALGIFASCVPYPEENPDPIPPVSSMFLLKTIQSNLDGTTLEQQYTYSDSKIVKVEASNGIKRVFTYNELDQISKIDVYNGTLLKETNEYVYDISENLISLLKIDRVSLIGTKWVYVHNANGTISYQKFSGDDLSQTNLVLTGELSSTKVVETITDPVTTDVTINTTVFAFDLKKNPFMNVVGYDKIFFADLRICLNMSNNILTQTSQTDDNEAVLDYTNDYVTYTNNGFPFKANVKQGGEIVATINYFY